MLPKLVDPRRLADKPVSYQEQIAVFELPRIDELTATKEAKVSVDLAFERDEQRRIRVSGQVSGSLGMVCQRCMGIVDISFDQEVDLQVVWTDEQSKAVSREFDPWQVGETANLHELVEDEILLTLPVVAKHPEGECQAPEIPGKDLVFEEEEGRQRPFEILKDLAKSPGK